jgi:hypothetical protein
MAALFIGVAAIAVFAQTLHAAERYTLIDKAVRWESKFAPIAEITTRDNVSGEKRRFEVQLSAREIPEGAQGDELEAQIAADRMLIVAARGPLCKEVTILGLASGKITDSILGCRVSLSPDKSRAVYIYYGGRIITDDVVVIYDFARNPDGNDSSGYVGRQFVPKGIILFPPENKAQRLFTTKSDPLKVVTSPFAWCKNDRIAFLAATAKIGDNVQLGDLSLIEMSLSSDPRQAKVIADLQVDAMTFRAPPSDEWPIQRALPLFSAKELLYNADCSSITIISLPTGPYDAKTITLPLGNRK